MQFIYISGLVITIISIIYYLFLFTCLFIYLMCVCVCVCVWELINYTVSVLVAHLE